MQLNCTLLKSYFSTVVKAFGIGNVLGNEAGGYPILPDVLACNVLVEFGALDHNPPIIELVRIQTPLALRNVAVTLVMVGVVNLPHFSLPSEI